MSVKNRIVGDEGTRTSLKVRVKTPAQVVEIIDASQGVLVLVL